MKNPKIQQRLQKLNKALIALELVVKKPMDPDRSNIDATIQRFEFTIEFVWQLLKAILEDQGVKLQYPKEVLQTAFKGHLIDNEDTWLNMLRDRNLSSHTYDEKLADKIFANIQTYMPILRSTTDGFNAKY